MITIGSNKSRVVDGIKHAVDRAGWVKGADLANANVNKAAAYWEALIGVGRVDSGADS